MNSKNIFKTLSLSLVLTLIFPLLYQFFDAEKVVAATASDTVVITLNVTAGISISSPPDTPMSQAIGVSADVATASSTWNVKTNSVGGYVLSVQASTNPAMQNASSTIPDYTPAVTDTPETWSVSSGTYEFGYSAFGPRVPTGTWGTDTDCNGATINDFSTSLKYQNLKTSDRQIASWTATTTTAGDNSTVCYAVQQNNSYIPSGTYTATVTATAVTQ